jgi:hypothetical protein
MSIKVIVSRNTFHLKEMSDPMAEEKRTTKQILRRREKLSREYDPGVIRVEASMGKRWIGWRTSDGKKGNVVTYNLNDKIPSLTN